MIQVSYTYKFVSMLYAAMVHLLLILIIHIVYPLPNEIESDHSVFMYMQVFPHTSMKAVYSGTAKGYGPRAAYYCSKHTCTCMRKGRGFRAWRRGELYTLNLYTSNIIIVKYISD